ncbi:MAG: hypothetical protein KJ709_03920 [Nanoarchaeota archaeon]|nr:hypothetical protein [Nanoarchaeota archaeon]
MTPLAEKLKTQRTNGRIDWDFLRRTRPDVSLAYSEPDREEEKETVRVEQDGNIIIFSSPIRRFGMVLANPDALMDDAQEGLYDHINNFLMAEGYDGLDFYCPAESVLHRPTHGVLAPVNRPDYTHSVWICTCKRSYVFDRVNGPPRLEERTYTRLS